MATIRDIAVADSYRGTPSLGASLDNAIKIDAEPMFRLSQYTYLHNSQQRANEEREAQARLKELADFTALDWENAIPTEREQAVKIINDFKDYSKNVATKDLKDPNIYLDYKQKLNDAKRGVKNINARFISYGGRKEAIAKATDPSVKQYLKSKLDRDIANSTINDPLPLLDEYNVKPAVIPKPILRDVKVYKIEGDFSREVENKNIVDVPKVQSLAFGIVAQKQADFDKAAPEEREAFNAFGTLQELEDAKVFTDVILGDTYRDPTTKEVDLNKLLASGSPVAGTIQQMIKVNEERAVMRERIRRGDFANQFKESDFPDMVWKDGTSAQELIELKILAQGTDKQMYSEDGTYTGARAKVDAQNIDRAQLAETIRHNKATENINKGQLAQRKTEWQATQKGSETQLNGAMSFANRLYTEMKSLADANGVISPDNLRKLNAEQLKYLGIEQNIIGTDGKAVKAGLTPLTFDAKKEYAIQIVDGKINVLEGRSENDGKLEKTADGRYIGILVPDKSTTRENIATNRLNEELSKAGAKELNTYWGIDVTGENTETTTEKSSSKSGASSSTAAGGTSPNYSIKGTTYTKDKLLELGYTEAQIQEAIQLGTIKPQK